MNEVRNGEQKEQKYLFFEICYACQKLHKFHSLLIKDTPLLTWSYIDELRNGRKLKCENKPFIIFILILLRPYIMGSELELRLCQNLRNLAKFYLQEKSSDLPSYW